MTFVASLRHEVAELEKELGRNPLYQKLQNAKRLLAAYERDDPAQAPDVPPTSTRTSPKGTSARVIESARQFLEGRDAPTPIAEIVRALATEGV